PAVSAGPPVGSPAPLTIADFQNVLTDSAFGIRSGGLRSVVRRGVGNVEFGGTYRWYDSKPGAPTSAADSARWWLRSALSAAYSLGVARPGAGELIDAPLGRPASGVRAGGVVDLGRGVRYSISAAAAIARWSGVALGVRAPAAGNDAFPPAARLTSIRYTPGAEVQFDVAPRLALSEAIALAATWTSRHRDGDTYTITGESPSPALLAFDVPPGLSAVGAASAEHRFGASVGYSTLAAWKRGTTRWPLEI